MTISELIQRLEALKQIHGDLAVEIYASYDGGYAAAGGPIHEVEVKDLGSGSWYESYRGYSKFIELSNNDDC